MAKPEPQQDGSSTSVGRARALRERVRSNAGAITFMGSRLVLIGCGFATYAIVARKLTTAEFGVYGVIGAIVNVLNTVFGTGTNQAISRLVSRNKEAAATLLVRGLWWASGLTILAAAGVLLGAPVVAAVLRDDALTVPMMIVALVPGFYALNATYAGFLNGMRELSRQGFVNMALSLARLLFIGAAAILGFGVEGTLWGSVAAAAVGVIAARALARIPSEAARLEIPAFRFARMMLSFIGVSLLLQLLLANDLLLLKRLSPAASANHEAGLYTAGQSVARIPYYFLIGVSQMVYPRISASMRRDGGASARRASSLVLSGLLVALLGVLVLCMPLADDIIRLVYPARYAEGAATLNWLLAASAALSLAEAALTMLSGAGGPRYSVLVLLVAVVCQISLGVVMIPRHGPIGAAQATLLASVLAVLIAGAQLRRLLDTTLQGRLLGTAVLPLGVLAASSFLWERWGMPPFATLAFMTVAYGGYILSVYRMNARELRQGLALGADVPAAAGEVAR